jgi:hypothetical protein
MKRHLWLVLLPVLVLSLWFNWRALHSAGTGRPADPAPPGLSPPAAPSGPAIPEAIDFSGTGLDDAAWKLDPGLPPAVIPDQIPEDSLPAAPAMPAAWDLNLPLQPEPVSGGK